VDTREATRFRIRATEVLRTYRFKGFVLDDCKLSVHPTAPNPRFGDVLPNRSYPFLPSTRPPTSPHPPLRSVANRNFKLGQSHRN
jgi:hypothetical protein